MNIKNLFIEKQLLENSLLKKRALGIQEKIVAQNPSISISFIDSYDEVFNWVKRPYLAKRNGLNIIIAEKKGTLIKAAKETYGLPGDVAHYYLSNAFNCIYECQYCFLQGYFNSPDLAFFINYEKMEEEILLAQEREQKPLWIHTGEYSDSLAMSHYLDEVSYFYKMIAKNSLLTLMLRTKSSQIGPLLTLPPLNRFIVSYSLSPQSQIKTYDLKTPSLLKRVEAIKKVLAHGHFVSFHFDPIIWSKDLLTQYQELFFSLFESFSSQEKAQIISCSLGMVRFTDSVFKEVKKNYPESFLSQMPLYENKGFDTGYKGLVRYPLSLRQKVLGQLKDLLSSYLSSEKIYVCME